MKTVPSQIASLFARHAALSGFSVRGREEIPDSCPRSGDEGELFVGDIGISPAINAQQYAEIIQELVATLSELLSEQPEAAESLRGRTFARVLH
jgi:phosphotransacetylase